MINDDGCVLGGMGVVLSFLLLWERKENLSAALIQKNMLNTLSKLSEAWKGNS